VSPRPQCAGSRGRFKSEYGRSSPHPSLFSQESAPGATLGEVRLQRLTKARATYGIVDGLLNRSIDNHAIRRC
jgi:hypothetical protein